MDEFLMFLAAAKALVDLATAIHKLLSEVLGDDESEEEEGR